MNILIVKLSAIGDVIHTLPALNALRQHYPEAHITWLVEEAAYDLVKGHEALDRVLVSKRKRWLKDLRGSGCFKAVKESYGFLKELRDTHYDLILDFQALLKSGILIALAKGERKVGFGRGLEHMEHSYIFLNERIPAVDMEHHALSRGLMLLNALGIPTPEVEYKLPLFDDNRQKVEDLLRRYDVENPQQIVAINPVAKWETKLWSNQKFAHLADSLIEEYACEIVFTGSLNDRPAIDNIISKMKSRAANLAGETTLKELAALYSKAQMVISTDTGPMHLAAAVGTPVVALFGPTAPWRTGPYGSGHQIVRVDLECAPCFKRHCETTECMHQIAAAQVLEAASKIIGNV
ncbi:lipopolysaccharide heptosyltransferase II [Thermodesulfobacteriota bacterium]